MSQLINLYQPELLEPKQPRSIRLMLLALVLTLVLLAAYCLLIGAQTRSLHEELRALQAKRAEVAENLARLQQVPPPQKNPSLQLEVERMVAELEAKRPLVERFQLPTGSSQGFSAELQGLARRTPEGLWLRRIVLAKDDGRSALEGSSLRPELVPLFLQNLNAETVFAGMDFSGFRLFRPEEDGGQLEFIVETAREKKP